MLFSYGIVYLLMLQFVIPEFKGIAVLDIVNAHCQFRNSHTLCLKLNTLWYSFDYFFFPLIQTSCPFKAVIICFKDRCFKSLCASCYIIMYLPLDQVWQMSLFFLSGMQVSLPLFRSSESYSCIYHLDPAVSQRLFSEWKRVNRSICIKWHFYMTTNARFLMFVLWSVSIWGEWKNPRCYIAQAKPS